MQAVLNQALEDLEDRIQGLRARSKKEAGDKVGTAWAAFKKWVGEAIDALDESAMTKETKVRLSLALDMVAFSLGLTVLMMLCS
jgi:hypothetical protein